MNFRVCITEYDASADQQWPLGIWYLPSEPQPEPGQELRLPGYPGEEDGPAAPINIYEIDTISMAKDAAELSVIVRFLASTDTYGRTSACRYPVQMPFDLGAMTADDPIPEG